MARECEGALRPPAIQGFSLLSFIPAGERGAFFFFLLKAELKQNFPAKCYFNIQMKPSHGDAFSMK